MPDAIIDGTGSGHPVGVTASNEMKVQASVSGLGLEDFTLRYKQVIDYEGGYNPIYLGLADPGTSEGSPSWMIRKNVFDSQSLFVSGLFASGNNTFDKVWNDRSGTNEAYS